MMYHVYVPGDPQGKLRPRAAMVRGHAMVYTPKTTANYENLVRMAFLERYQDCEPLSGPLEVEIIFNFAPPKSAYWPVNKKHNGELRDGWLCKPHTSTPDIDNLIKSILDGLNGVAFKDDSQIWRVTASKTYNARPGVHVRIVGGDGDGSTD